MNEFLHGNYSFSNQYMELIFIMYMSKFFDINCKIKH